MTRGVRLTMVGVLGIAVALRLWGITHGLPFTMARPDEREALEHTLGFAMGDWSPHWFVYPNLFFWLVWGWIQTLLALMRVVGDVPSYNELLAGDVGRLILLGRLASVAVGTATVALVYRYGSRLGGPLLGVVAALLLAVNFLHVRESHALKADVYLTFVVPIALAALAAWVDDPRPARAYVAGIAIGIATGLKYPGVLLLFPLWHADQLIARATGARRFWPSPTAWRAGLVATVVFMACCPSMFTDRDLFVTGFDFSVRVVYGVQPHLAPPPNATLLELVAWYAATRTFVYHAVVSFWHGCGAAFALATPAALVFALRRSQPTFVRLGAAFVPCYFAIIGLSQVGQSRYATPLMPIMALLIARATLALSARLGAWRPAALAVFTIALIAQPAASSIAHDRLAARADTRALALEWMRDHLPPGAVVARLGSTYFPVADPEVPPAVSIADLPIGATDLDSFGVTHVITHEHPLPFSQPQPAQMAALAPRLVPLVTFDPFRGSARGQYEELDAYFIPYAGFATIARPGPLVRIYRWSPAS